MNVLVKLYLLKLKGQLRHIFSKPSSAIITIILVLIYGGGFIAFLMNPEKAMTLANLQDIQGAIMIAIGFSALMIGSLLMQKRSALFFENDSFYLFTSPFKRSQIMHYLMSNTILSSLMFGAISILMLVFFGGHIGYQASFLLMAFLMISLISFFFIVLKDYVYLLTMQRDSYKHIPRYVVLFFIALVLVLFGIVAAQHDFQLNVAGPAFLASDMFYFIPMFGWAKLVLVSMITNDMFNMVIGFLLVIGAAAAIFVCMSRYKGDFVEQAMMDAESFTAYYKEARAGKRVNLSEKKIKTVNATFKQGANAIFSKNVLLMKKTNDIIRSQDIIMLAIYFVISFLMDGGFYFFCYMMIFWLFFTVQYSDFMQDMNHYQVYLIPDRPLKKLWNAMKVTIIKLWLITIVTMILAGIIYQVSVITILQYIVMLCGYAFMFLSATILSLRLLKSRNNMFVENMLRTIIIFISSLPGIIVVIYFIQTYHTLTTSIMSTMIIMNLVMNFIISFLIIYCCKGMMNGRELKSE